jgi:hypothetical protein
MTEELAAGLERYDDGLASMWLNGERVGYLLVWIEPAKREPSGPHHSRSWSKSMKMAEPRDVPEVDFEAEFVGFDNVLLSYVVAGSFDPDISTHLANNAEYLREFEAGTFLLQGVTYEIRWITDASEKRRILRDLEEMGRDSLLSTDGPIGISSDIRVLIPTLNILLRGARIDLNAVVIEDGMLTLAGVVERPIPGRFAHGRFPIVVQVRYAFQLTIKNETDKPVLTVKSIHVDEQIVTIYGHDSSVVRFETAARSAHVVVASDAREVKRMFTWRAV